MEILTTTYMSNRYSPFQDWSANKGNIKGRLILIAFRIANFFKYVPAPIRFIGYPYLILYRVVVEWVLGIELPWKLTVGSGLSLHHGQALVVNPKVIIGQNCILRHSTTIGTTTSDSSIPIIGNNVDIGSNVVIIGDVKIGDNAVIGAGTVVVKNVDPDAIVVGNPMRVIRIKPPIH